MTLCKFEVNNVILLYSYILHSDDLNKVSWHIHHLIEFSFLCVVRTFKISLSNFQRQLTLEQHRFELQVSTYRNYFALNIIRSFSLNCTQTVIDWIHGFRACVLRNHGYIGLTIKLYVDFKLHGRSGLELFKGQLYTIQYC